MPFIIETLNILSLPVVVLAQDQHGPIVSSADGHDPHQSGGLSVEFDLSDVPGSLRLATIQEVLSHDLLVETGGREWRYNAVSGLRDAKGGMFYDIFRFRDQKWFMDEYDEVTTPLFRDAPFKGLQPWWSRFEFNIQFRLWLCTISDSGDLLETIGSIKWDLSWALVNDGEWVVQASSTSTESTIRTSLVAGGDIGTVRRVISAPDVKHETQKFFAPLEVQP